MANETFSSTSTDRDVVQDLFWDTDTEKIEVVHKINLEARKNARLGSTTTHYPNSAMFDNLVNLYHLDSHIIAITEFVYDEYNDDHYEYDHMETFPDERSSYPLTGMRQAVIVILNHTPTGSGTVSTTSGEIL